MRIGSTHNNGCGMTAAANAVQQPAETKEDMQTGALPEEEAEPLLAILNQEEEKQEQALSWLFETNKPKENPFMVTTSKSGNNYVKTSKPKDSSSRLTRRLVAAYGQFEVRQVVSDANSDLIQMRMIAALGKGEDAAAARANIKKLEKLIVRASRKIRDLDQEDVMKVRRARAEQKKQRDRAEQIKQELRKKQVARRSLENSYLLEDISDIILGRGARGGRDDPDRTTDVAAEAMISIQAEAMAAAEVSAESAGGGADASGGGEASMPGGAGVDMGGIDAAPVEGGGEI